MTQFNDHGREIWFNRFSWSYMPAHWKGIVYPTLIIALTVVFYLLVARISSVLSFIPLLTGWALTMWLCERHSPSRR